MTQTLVEPQDPWQRLQTDDQYAAAALQEVARRDFLWCCRSLLGYAELNLEHEALCRFLQDDPSPLKLILMPRYSFKSSVTTIGYALWRLLRDPNERILIYSDSTEKAEGFLLGIKNHLLGLNTKSRFRAVCGAWEVDPKRGVWNQSAITIATRTQAAVEPSVDTAGLETSKVGKHYDVILFDDLVTDKNVTTKELMDKAAECYRKSASLLKPGGLTILLGTRWHEGDLYGRLLAEHEGRGDLAVFLRDAEVGPGERPYPFADIGLTQAFLARQKAEQGSRIYSCLYRLAPQDDETRTFKAADFRFYNPAKTAEFERWVSTLFITCVLDAIPPPTSDHGDDAAITVVGADLNRCLYLLDAVAGRYLPEQQIEHVLALHAWWRFRAFGLETNAFQKMLQPMLEQRLRESRKDPRWQPFTITGFTGVTQGNKEQRIQGLQPWHEQGLLKFPGERLELLSGVWSQLAFQMLQFPHSQKDDLLDSLAYHLQLTRPGTERPVVTTLPYSSAAWYEREVWLKQRLHDRQRAPRWTRPPLPELAFS